MSKPFLKVTDFTDAIMTGIRSLQDQETLVGIPSGEASRDQLPNGESPEINNAAILFINEFGSPANNIPARNPMKTGIRRAQERIAEEYKTAAKKALSRGQAAVETHFERVGIIASNSVKQVINQQIDMDPPSDATLLAREREGFKGTKALIVTGQTRNAITYVVKRRSL